jgi:DNA-binding NarL/FixJ family response regulator
MPRLKVYIIDDNTLFLVAASRFLSDFCGVDVVGIAQSGEDGFLHIAKLRPDVVLLDQNMPGMSGLEAAARIRAKADAPAVVMVSLGATPQLREEAAKAGCAGLVSKVDFTAEMPPLIEKLAAGKRCGASAGDREAFRCAGD